MRMPGHPRTLSITLLALLVLSSVLPLRAGENPSVFPLGEVKPGMMGVVYTIFSSDEIERVDLEVIGILHNALGPKQDIILVELLGDKSAHTGVAAGMSGSPVYFDGKLAGALSLKLGAFTKEAIGGVTPIEDMLDVEKSSNPPPAAGRSRVSLPGDFAQLTAAGSGPFWVPIDTPLITSGLYPETLAQFGTQLSRWGVATMAGGSALPTTQDGVIQAGDMVGMDLVRGDLSISAGCTVTSVEGDRILACGHPLFGFGSVKITLSRAHVLMTLASSAESTKVITTGGTIGTLTEDRQTAVMGKLGRGPSMIPVDVELATPAAEKKFHFEVVESPQLPPLLIP